MHNIITYVLVIYHKYVEMSSLKKKITTENFINILKRIIWKDIFLNISYILSSIFLNIFKYFGIHDTILLGGLIDEKNFNRYFRWLWLER